MIVVKGPSLLCQAVYLYHFLVSLVIYRTWRQPLSCLCCVFLMKIKTWTRPVSVLHNVPSEESAIMLTTSRIYPMPGSQFLTHSYCLVTYRYLSYHFERTRILGELRLITVTSTFLLEFLEHTSHLPICRTRTRPHATHTPARSRYERRLRGLHAISESDSEELERLAVGGLE